MRNHREFYSRPEALESRIAPAAVIPTVSPDGRKATWTDVDGDSVTLTITKGTLDASNLDLESAGGGAILQGLNLTDVEFKGTAVTISAKPDKILGGDAAVNVGYINATGNALGAVKIVGDLARIDAGIPAPVAKTPAAILSLTTNSMGLYGDSVLDAPSPLVSEIVGKVGSITVKGAVQGVLINVTGDAFGSIGAVKIGGSLVGTTGADTGRIVTTGNVGAITIGQNITGGDGQHSGSIEVGGNLKSIVVTGSILGGRAANPGNDGSGKVRVDGSLGTATILGNLSGGTQQDSGVISTGGNAVAITIGGSITGGSAGATSGAIIVDGNIGALTVKGDVIGGAAQRSGYIDIAGNSAKIGIAGFVIGGSVPDSGVINLGNDATNSIGSFTLGRDVIGGSGEGSGRVHFDGIAKLAAFKGGIIGAAGESSGRVEFVSGAAVATVAGQVQGNSGEGSGSIVANGNIASLTVVGSLIGGKGDNSGNIFSTEKFSVLNILGNVVGGDLASSATADLVESGYVQAKSFGTINIGGTVRSGVDYNATEDLINSGAIRSQFEFGAINIKGSLEGNSTQRALITASGQEVVPVGTRNDLAIKTLKIGGAVRYADLLFGYNLTDDHTAAEANPDAQVGAVVVGGDWVATNLVAGIAYSETFGDGSDALANGVDRLDILARISAVAIRGQVLGTADNSSDQFGIVAQVVSSVRLNTTTPGPILISPPVGAAVPPVVKSPAPSGAVEVPLNPGKGNDNNPSSPLTNLGSTLDMRVFEVL
jgi:hypothetical protein